LRLNLAVIGRAHFGRGENLMATRKSSARKKSARSKKRGAARKSSKKRAGARKGGASKKRSSAAKRRSSTAKRRRSSAKRGGRQAAVARVKRVTQEVVQQATVAVQAGVETLKDFGGNLVDRVRNQGQGSGQT
jgi:hypothetical protein